jgi:hypothetical protein
MAHKKMGQASFVEAFLRPDVGVNRRLERRWRYFFSVSHSPSFW